MARRKELGAALESAAKDAMSLRGSVHENFDPTIVGLDEITKVPTLGPSPRASTHRRGLDAIMKPLHVPMDQRSRSNVISEMISSHRTRTCAGAGDCDERAVNAKAVLTCTPHSQVPVIVMNARSKRKLFAQAGKKPTIFETWNKGFGAGPEEHTFKDNK